MAVRKRKIKKLKPTAFALFLFIISFGAYLITAIFVRSYNVSLDQQTQQCNQEIAAVKNQNAALALEIQELSAYDRVVAIANADDMSLNQDNIIAVGN
ncbi:MAG: cell division protein FtsL [Erysipelotrichaceae bacterium]|nr:cell division protein FtsL [Erysipelotrichaceae bacterium]